MKEQGKNIKVVVQIPCFNEEKTLPITFADIPKSLNGAGIVLTQIIDDGSTDRTRTVAEELGVDSIVSLPVNRGLSAAFKSGVARAIELDAHILINTDGDNQYCGADIQLLIEPILEGRADIVVGCRPIDDHPDFSWIKKKLQKIGSWVFRRLSSTEVKDVPSGFRAFSRKALLKMNVYTDYSHTLETLIQAQYLGLNIESVDIRVNKKTRESRLFKNMFQYIFKSSMTVLNVFIIYKSSRFFVFLSSIAFALSAFLAGRYLFLVLIGGGPPTAFWPSVILSGSLLVLSVQLLLTGAICHLISANRKLDEEIVSRLRALPSEPRVTRDSSSNPEPKTDRTCVE